MAELKKTRVSRPAPTVGICLLRRFSQPSLLLAPGSSPLRKPARTPGSFHYPCPPLWKIGGSRATALLSIPCGTDVSKTEPQFTPRTWPLMSQDATPMLRAYRQCPVTVALARSQTRLMDALLTQPNANAVIAAARLLRLMSPYPLRWTQTPISGSAA